MKYVVIAALLGTIFRNTEGGLHWLILASASVVAAGIIRVKVLVPLLHTLKKVDDGVEILLTIPTWRKTVETRMTEFEEHLADLVLHSPAPIRDEVWTEEERRQRLSEGEPE